MGQYYLAIFLADKGTLPDKEYIRGFVNPHSCCNGAKLTEHAYACTKTVQSVIFYLSCEGHFYKSRLVWAGDYADDEPETNENLYKVACDEEQKAFGPAKAKEDYVFFVNHTKKEYVDMRKFDNNTPHPIPLLTAEGNGRGGGDYNDDLGQEFVGIWARDVVSVEWSKPDDSYTNRTDIEFKQDQY